VFDQDRNPATLESPIPHENVLAAFDRHQKGFTLDRNEMTETAAVWDEERFERPGDSFTAGRFYAVKGKLAKALSQFNLRARLRIDLGPNM
jgi:hypothetical protein